MDDSTDEMKSNKSLVAKKMSRQDRVASAFLPFAIYIEKFDANNKKVKLSGKDFDELRMGVFTAFWLEPLDVQKKLKDDCERRLFNAKRGEVTFYTKSEFSQKFILRIINDQLKLPGIKARPPRVETRPNLHVHIPSALNRLQPELIVKTAIAMNTKIDCNPTFRSAKDNPRTKGRTIAFELPEGKLEQLQTWALENGATHFPMFTEWLRFWTVSTSPAKSRDSEISPLLPTGLTMASHSGSADQVDHAASIASKQASIPSMASTLQSATISTTPEASQATKAGLKTSLEVTPPVESSAEAALDKTSAKTQEVNPAIIMVTPTDASIQTLPGAADPASALPDSAAQAAAIDSSQPVEASTLQSALALNGSSPMTSLLITMTASNRGAQSVAEAGLSTSLTTIEATLATEVGLSTSSDVPLTDTPPSAELEKLTADSALADSAVKKNVQSCIALNRPRRACTSNSRRKQKLLPEYFCKI